MTGRRSVEALLFDLGGVAIDIDFERALHRWQRHSHHSLAEIRERFSMDVPYQRHERGEIDACDYFDHLRETLGLRASDEEILQGWNAIFVARIADTLDAVLAIRDTLPCFAFTNSNRSHQAARNAAYPEVAGAFDRVFVSSDLGLRKPESAAFEAVARSIGVEPAATLFFDDTVENIEGARDAGLQAVHVCEAADVRPVLITASVLIAVMAAFTALRLTNGLRALAPAARRPVIAKAAIALGGGIWSMHFVGMLALQLPVTVRYEALPTLISALFVTLVVGIGFIALHFGTRDWRRILVAGTLIGSGIVGMHYLGMSAVSGNCVASYSPGGIIIATAVGVAASTFGLWLAYHRRTRARRSRWSCPSRRS
jgi:putative hydrolase of the HAD superfamily